MSRNRRWCSWVAAVAVCVAGAWGAGGCAETSSSVRHGFPSVARSEIPPATLPAGVAEGIAFDIQLLVLPKTTLDKLPVTWDQNLAAELREQSGTPEDLAAHPEMKSVTFNAAALDAAGLASLMAATKEDRRFSLVTMPRVLLQNGQPGKIAMQEVSNYVADSTVKAGQPGDGVRQLETGFTLDLTAHLSDGRILTHLNTKVTTLDGIDTFTMGEKANGLASRRFVQIPRMNLTQFSTTAAISDGGTLVIAGPRMVGEAEVETGVPVLSRIPGLNRLFTNRSYVRDEGILVMLVTSRKVTADKK